MEALARERCFAHKFHAEFGIWIVALPHYVLLAALAHVKWIGSAFAGIGIDCNRDCLLIASYGCGHFSPPG
jgi:hypothetical protein